MRLRLSALLLALTLLGRANAFAQSIGAGTALPANCVVGNLFVLTGSAILNICTAENTWTTTAQTAIPSGLITLIASGACASGWTEVSALSGKMLRGTVAASGNVGQAAGADSMTPAVASLSAAGQVFTGNAVTSSAVSGGTPTGTISALTTGADSSTTGGVAKAIAQTPTFTGSALATHTHATTATGTNAASAVTGTLAAFDNRPAYVNVIFCSKN